MKRITVLALSLMGTLLLSLLLFPALAQAEKESEIHQYWGIPFDTVTPEEAERTLREKVGPASIDEFGGYRINDFGYEFDLMINFKNSKKVGAMRIIMSRVGNGWGRGEEFRDLARRDILQFIDMEGQLIQRYGEPDFRYFYTDTGKYKKKFLTRFMFSTNKWDVAQMMEVCDNDRYLVAHTVWGNTVLRVWVNWIDERKFGYLTKLDLQFEDKRPWKALPVIEEYPPVSAP